MIFIALLSILEITKDLIYLVLDLDYSLVSIGEIAPINLNLVEPHGLLPVKTVHSIYMIAMNTIFRNLYIQLEAQI